ncbi:flagellar motor stator protein MotA [Listeria monocytogenes]|nr:flagellar motor stator protein MotA [Listeria monocytogenes]EJU9592742.1 flagellar motor stator protein MotA [Listeria monocytogenes]EKG9599452.1 flagellar motor stator protein MotA [Listeria monocytogenes]EKH1118409.1 flagellar motor stator protein MotA [Listeria monocytogenes]
MEITTIIGLVLAVIVIAGSFMIQNISLAMFFSAEALIVIILGTITAVMMAHPWSDVKVVPKLFKILFTKEKMPDKVDVLVQYKEYADEIRRSGVLALEDSVDEIEDPFMKRGMRLVVDGQSSPEFLRDVLEEEVASMEERHAAYAKIFASAGAYAPTLGVLGAAMGLIHAMGEMSNPDKLSEAIAAAFVCTIFGIFTGYVLWTPFANKLKVKSQKEVHLRYMMIEGVVALQERNAPRVVEERLLSFLSPKEKDVLRNGKGKKTREVEEIERGQASQETAGGTR